jgi:nitrite reductase (NADH) small subunit/3-phenylpropionate/trans-cinnamate dioxygenase ferredoxin subunit
VSEPCWHDLGRAADLPDQKLHGRLIGGVRICYGRSGGDFFAVDDTCPHAGGSLTEGMLDDGLVICPLHAYAFETGSGRCIDDPSCSVSAYPVRVEGGIVQVQI